jgi:hypothetical protein
MKADRVRELNKDMARKIGAASVEGESRRRSWELNRACFRYRGVSAEEAPYDRSG